MEPSSMLHTGYNDTTPFQQLYLSEQQQPHPRPVSQQKMETPSKPGNDAVIMQQLASMVHCMAQTVRDLSALPGAHACISPDMAVVVEHIAAMTATPPKPQPQPQLQVAPLDLGGGCSHGTNSCEPMQLQDRSVLGNKQQPLTPPGRASCTPAQHSPVTPGAIWGSSAAAAAAATATATAHAAQVPVNLSTHSPRAQRASSTDNSSGGSDDGCCQPNSKRPCTDLLMAQHALAAVLQQKQLLTPSAQPRDSAAAATVPNNMVMAAAAAGAEARASAVAHSALFAGFPLPMPFASTMQDVQMPIAQPLSAGQHGGYETLSTQAISTAGLPAFAMTTALPAPGQQLSHAASIEDLMQAADILASMHNNNYNASGSPTHKANRQQNVCVAKQGTAKRPMPMAAATTAAAAADAPEPVTAPAPAAKKPRAPARPTTAKKAKGRRATDKHHKGKEAHFQTEVDKMPPETLAAVKALWAQHNGALPVMSLNKATGQAVHGVFNVIDGKKKIVTEDGTALDPADFEKLAERGNTRNWQMSIIIPGLHTKGGNKQALQLGHATRMLGVHNSTGATEAPAAAVAEVEEGS